MTRAAAFGVVAGWAALIHAQQVPVIPSPGGSFGVGRVGYDWVDASRAERASADPTAYRELMVYFWYPADTATDSRGFYIPGARDMDAMPEMRTRMQRAYGAS